MTDNLVMFLKSNAGFKIIAERQLGYTAIETEVVLAVRPDLSEYVTWIRYRGNEYYHGHYTFDFDFAVKDFQTRE